MFQAKFLYKELPFSQDEREKIKLLIQGNVYGYLGMLLEGREHFEEKSSTSQPTDLPSGAADQQGTVPL